MSATKFEATSLAIGSGHTERFDNKSMVRTRVHLQNETKRKRKNAHTKINENRIVLAHPL
jgi:hypothetical protein